jgi:hypothetical protein
MSYLSDFKRQYDYVQQVDSKQMCKVIHNGEMLLFSYYTVIGFKRAGTWYITDKRYSKTTSKQVNQFSNRHNVVRIPHDELIAYLEPLRLAGAGWN